MEEWIRKEENMERKNFKDQVITFNGLHRELPKGSKVKIEGYWDDISGKSWMFSVGNPACIIYAIRAGTSGLPTDDNVLYGHETESGLGHLIHISEIEIGEKNE